MKKGEKVMKSIKRIIALLLTAVMTMTMSVTAFVADGNNLTVSVQGNQDLNGQTISLYKLFDLSTSQSGETKNYAYTVNTATGYKDAIKSALGTSFIGTTDVQYAEAVKKLGADNSEGVQKFANDFTEYALKNGTTVQATTSEKITGKNTTSHEFNGLAKGYYLVYVTGGKKIQSSLVTVDGTTEVKLKTEAPNIEKKADKETVSIGQVVTYTVTGSVPDTTGYDQYVYTIHDELSNGLDFVNDANGTAVNGNAVKVTVAFKNATDASAAPTTAKLDVENNRKMSLDLSEWVRANQTNKGKEFTVTYYAKVNKDAVVTEKNSATLEYGNNPGDTTTTTPSEAKTPTYHLDINKIKKGSDEKLAGAKFRLYSREVDANANDESKAIKVSPVVAGVAGNYVVDPTSDNTVFESVASIEGQGYNLHVIGLAAGTYYLVETEAPSGYNKLIAPIKVVITKDGDDWTISKGDTKEDDKIIDVENSTGSLLPSTGGMGTIVFTVVAALLVLGVAVSFIRDRKREN